jgi:hypothetical protein
MNECAVGWNNSLYILGGSPWVSPEFSKLSLPIFSTSYNGSAWTDLPTPSVPLTFEWMTPGNDTWFDCVVAGNKLFAFGGAAGIQVFDLVQEQWQPLPIQTQGASIDEITSPYSLKAAMLDNTTAILVVVKSAAMALTFNTTTLTLTAFNISFTNSTMFYGYTLAVLNGTVYMLGGQEADDCLTTITEIDLGTQTARLAAELIIPMSGLSAVPYLDQMIYVVPGEGTI